MPEREITSPVDLCRPDGRLNPEAVGWTRHPLHRANLRGWGRTKRWEYWGIVSPTHAIGIQLSSLDYAAVHGLYVLDRRSTEEWRHDVTVPLGRGVALPDRAATGRVAAVAKDFLVDIDQPAAGTTGPTTIRATSPQITLALSVEQPAGHESMGVVVPWSGRRFQYTVKDLARPVSGTLTIDGTPHAVTDAYGVLDHGRGVWPYRMTWNWGAGSGPAGNAVQLGGGWTDGTGATENAIVVDGTVHKIGAALTWSYDRDDWHAPWRVTGEGVDATLVPEHVRESRTELVVLGNRTHQAFGMWTGTARADDGTTVALEGLVGWAEEARNRW
ncbi:DUF2804 domain-containing protein [Mumia zhuanghuii]|uniref:DUF2804 domain-containing protein n=1 Tax=Mumia zhuanghuii TaxID=2585211 RepID=A0A5C4MM80_9ACTN|nr:DUF2804 domain-containing protein [Mumia zhuanghuii]TNC43634.1 DUF2804 domain-containing protein [Mumia zhuanghuii]TNC46652.1 DUF2804 domain-containing protein [Mumia zhuanghuii]